MKNESFLFYQTVRDFVAVYLPKHCGASNNTVKSYKEALNLLIDYSKESLGIELPEMSFNHISRCLVDGFLECFEMERNCSVCSRNQRMSAVKSFLKYAAERDRTIMALYLDVKTIQKKKIQQVKEIEFFSESALEAILE